MSVDPHDPQRATPTQHEVFISYARRDYDKVRRIVDKIATLGVGLWLDQSAIEGGENFALSIARGIKLSRVFILMCSDAALRSRNVNREIMLAWRYERPYLPLLLEAIESFPEQVEFFLEGCQWIEVLDRPDAEWLPRVRRALTSAGVCVAAGSPATAAPAQPSAVASMPPATAHAPAALLAHRPADLDGLRRLASFNDRIWPIAADLIPSERQSDSTFRGMGGRPRHRFRLGSFLGLAIETDRPGHLLLIDEGAEGVIYCLCPSWFAPVTSIHGGTTYLPQAGARYESFQVSGQPGRELLLAIVSDEPLGLDWITPDPSTPARELDAQDVESLLTQLRRLEPTSWVAFATYFDVVL